MKRIIDTVKIALEKQIPKKPREHYHWREFTKEEKLENNQWFCGNCDWQIGEEDNYCNECGERIDWKQNKKKNEKV